MGQYSLRQLEMTGAIVSMLIPTILQRNNFHSIFIIFIMNRINDIDKMKSSVSFFLKWNSAKLASKSERRLQISL